MSPTVSGVFCRWTVMKSALGHQLLELDHLDAELLARSAGDVLVVGDEAHAERVGPLRHQGADAAEAEHAQRLAVQLDALPLRLLPPALP